jgi:hypothetical protein
MNTKEIWRLIPSLAGVLASSHGRLMVAPYVAPIPRGGVRQYGGEVTSGQWDGARFIYLHKGKTYKVHRLVCEAFNGPPPAESVCMHLDEDASNNRPENLAWGTQKQNLNAPGFLAYCRARTGHKSPAIKGRAKKQAAMSPPL